jgi:hypothetical protein
VITAEALRLNFTNEGGVQGTTRLLKNVMGLWMLQCCHQTWSAQGKHGYEHSELMELAAREQSFSCLVDPDHESFLRPGDMPSAIDQFCGRTHQPAPKSPAGYARAILESLAFKYRLVLGSLEKLTGKRIEQIRVIGGGAKNRLLNQLTADATGRTVLAGPAEATALGNVAMPRISRLKRDFGCESTTGLPIALMAAGFLPKVGEVAQRHPNLKLILDHLGRPSGVTSPAERWANLPEVLALAKYPNVAMKATGAPSYSDQTYPFRDMHDKLKQLYDAFGPTRWFWGTDITRMPCSWRQCVTLFTEELPWLRGRDLELVMGRAVCDWLGWKR